MIDSLKVAAATAAGKVAAEPSRLAKDVALMVADMRGNVRYIKMMVSENEDATFAVCAIEKIIEEIEDRISEARGSEHHYTNQILLGLQPLIEAANVRSSTHKLSDQETRRQVWAMTDGHCTYCACKLVDGGGGADQFCIEHVVPSSKGGPDNLVNYVPACRSCNNSKSDGHVFEHIRRLQQRQRPSASVIPIRDQANTSPIAEASA